MKDLDNYAFKDCIGFARLIVFDEDVSHIINSRASTEAFFIKQYKEEHNGEEPDPELIKQQLNGYLPKISVKNEIAAWNLITSVVDACLAKYPTTIEEDIELLKQDESTNTLGFNKRNCILYRKGEKQVLNSLKDVSKRVDEMV